MAAVSLIVRSINFFNFQFIVVISKCPKQSGFNPMYFNVANLIREFCFSTIQITECFTNFTDHRKETFDRVG